MTYTILTARYANPDHTAAVVQTAEAGAVALSLADTPEAWAAMLDAMTPEPHAAEPVAPRYVPKIIIVERLGAAGLLHAAHAALALDAPASALTPAQLLLRERWNAALQIPADDPDVRAMLTGIGAEPDAILAP